MPLQPRTFLLRFQLPHIGKKRYLRGLGLQIYIKWSIKVLEVWKKAIGVLSLAHMEKPAYSNILCLVFTRMFIINRNKRGDHYVFLEPEV